MNHLTRRHLLQASANAALLLTAQRSRAALGHSPFRIAVINDEISPDLEHACHVVANEFGLGWMELRSFWNKNILLLDDNELAEARRLVDRYQLRVSDIASPLYKVDWKGAPRSKFSPQRDG